MFFLASDVLAVEVVNQERSWLSPHGVCTSERPRRRARIVSELKLHWPALRKRLVLRTSTAKWPHLSRRLGVMVTVCMLSCAHKAIRRVCVLLHWSCRVYVFEMQVFIIAKWTSEYYRGVLFLPSQHIVSAEKADVVLAALGEQHRVHVPHADGTGVFEISAFLLGLGRDARNLTISADLPPTHFWDEKYGLRLCC